MSRSLFLPLCLLLMLASAARAEPPAAVPAPACEGPVSACYAAWGPGRAVTKPLRLGRLYGWRALDATHGILWLGVEEPYLVVLDEHCRGLAEPVHLESVQARHLTPGHDRLANRRRACRIEALYELEPSRLQGQGPTPARPVETPAAAVAPLPAAAPVPAE